MPVLHSNILGEGSPLLILHGFLGMSDNWKTLGNQYAKAGYQVHLIDQRNHGKSFHSETFDYPTLAKDLLKYMEHHKVAHAILLGHSMGGKTVMQFACNYPQRVQKLLVADIAPKYYPPHHHEIINALKRLPLDQLDSRTEADKALAKDIRDTGTRLFLLKNLYWVEKGKLGLRCNLEVLGDNMEAIGDTLEGHDQFSGPTLFLRGDRSEYIVAADESQIKKHFPNAQIVTIPKAGHWLHAENPKEFFDKSLAFIKG